MTMYRLSAPICLLCCAAACDPSSTDQGDSLDDDDTGEVDSDTMADTDDPSAPTTDGDSDPTGGDPTGDPGDALADSVFLYVHADDGYADSVRAYDIATDQSWVVTDFGGDVEIRSVAIHPDRTTLAISSFYQLQTADESEGIWRVPAAGGAPELMMEPWAGDDGEGQSIADLVYSYDGAHVYFGHSTSTTGGSTLARVAAAGGVPELFLDSSASCLGHVGPAPAPNGEQLVSVRFDCTDHALEGMILHDLPPSGPGQVFLPEGDLYGFESTAPQWSADASALLFVVNTKIDADADGLYDGDGAALMLMDTATGDSFELVPPVDDQRIFDFALSPDETHIVMCMGSAAGQDLVLADLTGAALSYRTLTTDGESCGTAW